MWWLCTAQSIVIITDLVSGAVHRVPTSVAGKLMKEGSNNKNIDTAHVLNVLALEDMSTTYVAWKVLIPTQPSPTVPSARVNKYQCVICVKITYQKGLSLNVCIYNDKDRWWLRTLDKKGVGENKCIIGCLRQEL